MATRTVPASPGTWHPEEKDEDGNFKGIRDIPMVKSTTSSHYSIFRQRIPEYDLKYVRNYLQFKNRLQGMELELGILKRNVYLKEVQSSECFARQTMALSRLVKEFSRNEKLMDLVSRYYDLVAEYDKIYIKRTQLKTILDEKLALIDKLIQEYNGITSVNLDRKLELGQKIKSIKLEVSGNLSAEIAEIDKRIDGIKREINEDVNDGIDKLLNGGSLSREFIDAVKEKFDEVFSDSGESEFSKKREEYQERVHEKQS